MRTFVAVSPDAAWRTALAAGLGPLRGDVPDVRWVREEHLHVTLAFLGDVGDARLRATVAATAPVVAEIEAFELMAGGAGAFPGWSRPRVVWLGFRDATPLVRLAEAVRTACASAGWIPGGAFTPHLTIGRVSRPLRANERDAVRSALEAMSVVHPFAVDRVEVFHSVLGKGGARHRVVERMPLNPAGPT